MQAFIANIILQAIGQSSLYTQVMIVSSIMEVDTQGYGVFDENASRQFHRNCHTCRNGPITFPSKLWFVVAHVCAFFGTRQA